LEARCGINAALFVPNCHSLIGGLELDMLRKFLGAAVILGLLTGAAAAQMPMPGISFGKDEKKKLTPDEQAAQDARDRAYKSELNKIPEKKANDPWGNIRDTGQPQAARTPSKTKPQ
jgi:hypothetical protein